MCESVEKYYYPTRHSPLSALRSCYKQTKVISPLDSLDDLVFQVSHHQASTVIAIKRLP